MKTYDDFGELALGSRLKFISDLMFAKADRLYKSLDLPFQGHWFPVVASLHKHGEMGVTELAKGMGQTHSAISQLSMKLGKEGLIQSRKDPQDERRRLISLTPAAENLVSDLSPIWRDIQAHYRLLLEEICPDLQRDLSHLESRLTSDDFEHDMLRRQTARQPGAIAITRYLQEHQQAFFDLNARWIDKYFVMEAYDRKLLSDPEQYVLKPGGMVFFAVFEEKAIGTCAIYPEEPGIFELTKMGVDPAFQAMDIGRNLALAAIKFFKSTRGTMLFLESSSKLPNALRLYEQLGFQLQPNSKPGSVYDRSDVYMIWKDGDT